jgi:K+:H+ antiporter
MHHHPALLQDVIIFLIVAGLLVPVMQRLAISPVLGFIVTGLVIGPYGLGRFTEAFPWLSYVVIADAEGVRTFAELGVVFLLFMIGLELSVERLISMRHLVFGLGGLQVVLSSIVIGLIAYAFGNSAQAAMVIGSCLALSSTAIVMQLLIETKRLTTPTGRVSFSILLFQDLAVVPILFLTGVLGETGGNGMAAGLMMALAKAAAVICVIFLIGRLVVRPLFRFVGTTKSRELFMAMVLLAIIGTAVITERAGLSLALGAFLAGLLLAETEYRHQIEVDVEPFKGLLLGLFFMSIGLSLDLTAVWQDPLRIIASVIGLLAIKSAIIYALARAFGVARPVAAESALLLGQGGEFAFIVLALALSLSVVARDVAHFILLVTIVSMLITPLLSRLARSVGTYLTPPPSIDSAATGLAPPDVSDDLLVNHVIVAGYGRVGQLLGSLLESQHIAHVALDLDVATVARFRNDSHPVYYGDASQTDILQRLGINNATSFVVTMDNRDAAEQIVAAVRAAYPTLPIIARARDREHGLKLLEKGATSVVPETIEASLDLAEVVFCNAGIGAEASRQIVADRRQLERAALSS